MKGKDNRPSASCRYLIIMFTPVVSLRSLQVDVQQGQVVTFISDVHLGFGDRKRDIAREDRLLTVLRSCAETSAHLFIVGDLFDLWFDYGTVIPKDHIRTLALLKELREGGLPITYLIGNHDFGHYRYFKEDLGIEIETGDIDATIAGKHVYICHGDGKAQNDVGYLILRSVLGNTLAQWLYRWVHPDWGMKLAARTSHGSRGHTSAKEYGPHDGLQAFAHDRIEEGYEIVIMGHRHKAAVEKYRNGLYVNLGHWLGNGATYGVLSPNDGFTLIEVPPTPSH